MSGNLVEVALCHAGRGWPVFPLEPGGKRPLGRLVPHGLKEATTDAAQINRWWTAAPDANIGLRTGDRFDTLDIDGPEALSALERAMPLAERPDDDSIIIGPTVHTPRGWHVYVAPTGGNTTNLSGLAGVDWRGRGGYVVAPGSVKADGVWWSWYLPDDPLYGPCAEIRPPPAWLLDLLTRRHEPSPQVAQSAQGPGSVAAYARAALERACGRLATAAEGSRNHTLNAEAHGLGRLVGGRQLTADEAGQALLAVALRAGLAEPEAVATIRSGLTAGMRDPKRLTP